MPRKSPHELRPGMTLTKDVHNLDGRPLFARGQSLSEEQIEILMMWGVESVHVDGAGPPSDTQPIDRFSRQIRREAETRVQQRFRLVKSAHPAVEAIRRMAVLQDAKTQQADSSAS